MNTQNAKQINSSAKKPLIHYCFLISLVLAGCLPFMVPFDAARNIDMQGLLLLIAGGFAWITVLVERQVRLEPLSQWLLSIFLACCLISLLVNPHKSYDLLGAPYIRLGAASFLAYVGLSLALKRVPTERLINYLYIGSIGLAVISLPYYLLKYHSSSRIGGLFAQADIFAAFLGCGLLLGLHILQKYSSWKWQIYAAQIFMAALLVLTGTRAVLISVILLWIIWQFQFNRTRLRRYALLYAATILILLAGLSVLPSNRVTSSRYAAISIGYRLTLQSFAVRASSEKPLWGYGSGNLADALSCSRLTAKALQATCHQGYFFNSSHNIFIDRFIGIGWIGGSAFLLLVIRSIYKGVINKKEPTVITYVMALLLLYYLTNVTSVTLELLFWVILLRPLYLETKT